MYVVSCVLVDLEILLYLLAKIALTSLNYKVLSSGSRAKHLPHGRIACVRETLVFAASCRFCASIYLCACLVHIYSTNQISAY